MRQPEGKLQELKGEAQKTVGAVKDAAHDAVDRANTSSTADTVKGYANEAVGKIKQRVGSATSNSDLEADGLAQEVEGDIQKLTGRAKRDTGT